jgi:hypothetical protein
MHHVNQSQTIDQGTGRDAAIQIITTPARAAKTLNAHHLKTCAGFYPTAVCSRAFGARVRKGVLEITPDFGDTWQAVDLATIEFRDHNGRKIFL